MSPTGYGVCRRAPQREGRTMRSPSLGRSCPAWVLLLLSVACAPAPPSDWDETRARIRAAFPEIPQISTAQLAQWMAAAPETVLLLDVRRPEEFVVSHIPGAHPAPTLEAALRWVARRRKGQRIVLYCSVGFRSSKMAKQLLDRGISGIHNLEGSIFAWANEGRPLTDGVKPVQRVHPFDERWGRLLDPRLWAWHPESPQGTRASRKAQEPSL
ncbi:MAG: rhodanese-like domain-containing protein [Deltaproteobacteria bacterium]|nr:MAG: rhodanese-like domain-containing protein [Deltaproteobacteria bacterium]